jgi:hypothetical protein
LSEKPHRNNKWKPNTIIRSTLITDSPPRHPRQPIKAPPSFPRQLQRLIRNHPRDRDQERPHGTSIKKVTHKSSSINGKKDRRDDQSGWDQDVVETIEDHHGKKVNEYRIKEGKKMPKAIKS